MISTRMRDPRLHAEFFIELEEVTLSYGQGERRVDALGVTTLRLKQGEFVALVGPSGCGKSTILKLVSGLVPATSGYVYVAGREVGAEAVRVGMAFQNPTMLPWLTVRDNVMLPLKIVPPFRAQYRAKRGSEFRDRADALLREVGLAQFGDKHPWQLSGGMLQRASLCRALIHEPQLLMLDEPFGALDQFTREELWAIMQELWLKLRPTVLLVTHDLKEAGYLANRICVMRARPGQIIDDADVPFARPRTIEMSYTPAFVAMTPQLRRRLASTACIVGFFLIWEALCRLFSVSDIVLPKPSEIIVTLFAQLPALWPHIVQTLYTTLIGFGLGIAIGIALGVMIGSSRLAYDVAYPLLIGFATIPKVAVVPIFVLWFGAGAVPAVLTAMIMCIFPIVVNVATGLATTEPELEDVMRALHASKLDILWNVGLPRTMPYFFASLKVSVTLAFVGTVISETVASNRGIGNVMMIASSNFDVPLVFAGLLILAVLGVVLYAAFSLIESNITGWAHRKDDVAIG